VKALARARGISIEEAGRFARYQLFERIRENMAAHVVATAHHRDDTVETVFLRLLRGTSASGLRGIPPVRGTIVRPLIETTRADILSFLHTHGHEYRTDETNLESNSDRNVVRNRLFPVIRERFPRFPEAVMSAVELMTEDEACLEEQAAELADRAIHVRGGIMRCEVPALVRARRALASRAVLTGLFVLTGAHARWSREHVRGIMSLARSNRPSARLDLPYALQATRDYDTLTIGPRLQNGGRESFTMVLDGPGSYAVPHAGLRVHAWIGEAVTVRAAGFDGRTAAVFDADQIGFPLIVRSMQPGDRMRPWGMGGSAKVKKLFIDCKIPRARRRRMPLVIKECEVIWIPLVRRSEVAPLRPDSRRALVLQVERT
jgi:tRNA(Ile)-lysidine synthase